MALELPDARSLSPETLEALRVRAIHAVEELGLAQKQVAQILGVKQLALSSYYLLLQLVLSQ